MALGARVLRGHTGGGGGTETAPTRTVGAVPSCVHLGVLAQPHDAGTRCLAAALVGDALDESGARRRLHDIELLADHLERLDGLTHDAERALAVVAVLVVKLHEVKAVVVNAQADEE